MLSFIEKTMNETFTNGTTFPNVHSVTFLRGYESYEKDNNTILELKVPGFSKKDVEVSIDDDILYITADSGGKDELGFRSNSIKKRFNLPKNSNASEIEASVKDGLLTITIPKNTYTNKIKVK